MYRKLAIVVGLVMLSAAAALAQEAPEAKELSGMSIVGNDDAPKSLYIVPWKSSEIGVETSLSRMLNERDAAVDRDVFRRELEFYQVSVATQAAEHQEKRHFFSVAPQF